ncbi:DNA internalization-related competence protein ComEC/Rec2 [Lysobacter spongiae]|uniref:DNA internalization-related competence protein ComEC/Rec2 n=1 Tax=Marilutibacter spongiae TaxID=2025720 RepID=A0A7W3Y522_9GAMM|nr:DNA internalization-related competence protein ComEC/Rec2 [Lysobacter spongiae]MBB1059416.1 DNA internalization-related competence protein ComEC/Rec2 [Lysobacter spongiae]
MIPAARTPPDAPTPSHAGPPLVGPAVATCVLAGCLAALWLPRFPPLWVGLPALLAGAGLLLATPRLRLPAGVLLGLGLAALHAQHALSLQLPPRLEKTTASVTGRIAGLPIHEAGRTRFEFRVDDAPPAPAVLRGRLVRASLRDPALDARMRYRAGQRWRLDLRLRAPRGLRNPGGFDGERSALAARLAAQGHVVAPAGALMLSPASGIDAWRESMSARIGEGVEAPSSRFVRALALGDTRGLDDSDWALLRAVGLTHLVAISGFHVGLVAGFAALLAQALWWCFPGLSRRLPRPLAAALAGVIGAGLYAAVAGFALPTVRTVLMIAAVATMRLGRRRVDMPGALAVAALVMLLLDPLSVLSAGFWLSFMGVAWLLWCLPDPERRPLRAFLSAQAVATLGLLPLSVALFGQASLAGPVANLVAVPWWSLVVVPLALAGTALDSLFAGAGTGLWRLSALCFDLAWPLFERLGHSPLAVRWIPESDAWALLLALLGAFWLLLPRAVPGRALALLLWLPLLWPARQLPGYGEAELQVLDVGQGLAVLVRTARHQMLYDAGPASRDGEYDAGARVVVPALRALGVGRLDRIMLSHADRDHAGGLEAVVEAFPGAALVAPDGAGVGAQRPCVSGDRWQWDGVRFEVLHPTPYFPYLRNESSCVLRIEAAGATALFTGDISEVVETRLLNLRRTDLRADVVLVPHHGSGSSSSASFIAATGARHALVSSGHGNRFGHPRPAVVSRWRAAGAEVHDTARAGSLAVRLAPGGATVESRRVAQPRGWDAESRGRAASEAR